MDLASYIRDVPDFPQRGVLFKDLTPLLKEGDAFRLAVDGLVSQLRSYQADMVVAVESRGFIFGAPVAYQLGLGLVPVRKLGKLPAATVSTEYELEYGTNTLEMHSDALQAGQRILLIDDLLATGGTIGAAIELVEKLGAHVAAVAFLAELTALRGRRRLGAYNVVSLLEL